MSLWYTQSSLRDCPGIHNQGNRSMHRKPLAQPVQHIVLRDQTGPASLKKVEQKTEDPYGKFALISYLGSHVKAPSTPSNHLRGS